MNCHLRDIGIPSVAITSTDDASFETVWWNVAISPGKNVYEKMLKYIIYYYHVSENDLKHSALQWNALDVNESVLYKTKIPGNKKYEN